jgi:hypothetical protein
LVLEHDDETADHQAASARPRPSHGRAPIRWLHPVSARRSRDRREDCRIASAPAYFRALSYLLPLKADTVIVPHAAHRHRLLDDQFAEALARDGDASSGGALVRSRDRKRDLRTMTTDHDRRPSGQQNRVLFARLTEAMSAAGRSYLKGWAGASNLIAFKGEPDEQGRPVWNLYLIERPRQERQFRDSGAAEGARSG